jgi:chromosome partitioning protein
MVVWRHVVMHRQRARPLKVIAFESQKGGTGKTTLALHMGVAAAEDGERVVIVDTDPQASATGWKLNREAERPVVVSIRGAGDIDGVITAARHDDMTLCIIDTAPHADPDAARIARLADLVVMPCRPTALDLAAASNAARITRAAQANGVFVLSACPPRAPEIEEARTALGGNGFDVCPVTITERRAFSRALATGRTVTEFEGKGKAAKEIRGLWQWLKGRLNHGKDD